MANKIVLLCSGGFDSVVLANYVRDWKGDKAKIHTLFFDYGQKSCKMERECAIKVSEKIRAEFKEIKLPKFEWTKSDFYSPEYSGEDKEYLEMRNLVFISYALSYAESIGAKKIYMALLKHIVPYFDGSKHFIKTLNELVKEKGIKISAPFLKFYKYGLVDLISAYGITEDDFFTCDNPVNSKPCGKCPDCVDLKEIFKISRNKTT